MNAEDWFDDCNIKDKLADIVGKLNGSTINDSNLEIFLKGLSDIVESAHQFNDVVPRVILTVLEAANSEQCLNELFRDAFNAVSHREFGNSYELNKLEYTENNHKVMVDFEIREP